ncbi:MAG: sigma-70 family RNA polymerase sigma factor [Phycisphaerales bacterium]|nr:MAG: sigma-70 family RNA polymerase sigma factor [Phycisphaerales bacterium]
MLEDEKLKWQFKCGSPQALARIYEKYVDTLLTLAMGLLNNTAEAEDVVQDVFVSFAKSANGFTLRGNLKAYLSTAVVNRVRDRIRRQRHRPGTREAKAPAASEARGPEEQLVFSEYAGRLSEALDQLPREQRETIVLRLKANMKFKDIARLQGTSVNTALGRYRYGLQKLRSSINGEVEYDI